MQISSVISKPLQYAAQNKPIQRAIEKITSNKVGRVAAVAVLGANIIKDIAETGIDCYASLNNKKIDEKQRKFLAAYDLSEGFVTWVTQIVLGLTILRENVQKNMFEGLFRSFKSKSPKMIEKYEKGRAGFAIASSLLFSVVVGKRLIVPLIATPLATKVSKFFIDHDHKHHDKHDDKHDCKHDDKH